MAHRKKPRRPTAGRNSQPVPRNGLAEAARGLEFAERNLDEAEVAFDVITEKLALAARNLHRARGRLRKAQEVFAGAPARVRS